MRGIILAGGKGTRLLPYTIVIPKPMLPIGNMPIIEIIAKQMAYFGIEDIVISLGHLSNMIEHYLESKSGEEGFPRMNFHLEKNSLGTAGAVKDIRDISEDVLVMNGDILTNVNIADMISTHEQSGAALTIAIRKTNHQLPIGKVEINDFGQVIKFEEKPSLTFWDNIGIYIYSRKALGYIDNNEKIDVNDLIDRLLINNEKIQAFVSEGLYYWIDIGTHADYEKANRDIANQLHNFPFIKGVEL